MKNPIVPNKLTLNEFILILLTMQRIYIAYVFLNLPNTSGEYINT